jgi:hypothetical protein
MANRRMADIGGKAVVRKHIAFRGRCGIGRKLTGHGAFPHNPALVARLSLRSAGRKTYSGAGRVRDIETVLQHLEARHDIACDRQDDRELRRSDLAGCLDPGLERTNDRGASVACENVLAICVRLSLGLTVQV